MAEPLWDSEDTARYLKVPSKTLSNWRYLGRGPAFIRVGGAVRYDPRDVIAWAEAQRVETAL
jgi:hypothetical protein